MTDIELLANVINSLDRINIPVSLTQQIGIPIVNANNQLKALYNAIQKKVEDEQKDDESEPEIKMEVVNELPEGVKVAEANFDAPQE